jgi:glycosyltransferase involved in cell wall biosynthesis
VILALNVIDESKTTVIPGSGVELEAYPHVAEPEAVPVAIFAARLLRDKGVFEFIEAAAILRSRGVEARFLLVGSPDSGNPASVTVDELERFKREGVVEVMGYRQDIAELFANSNIVVLPSYYGEGLPKVLIEAAACGRAVVTTDHPGCRDAIEPGRSGILVPVRDARTLADALQTLIEDASLRHQYGKAGRALAERLFSVNHVIDAHLNIYRQLLEAKKREQ